LSGLVCYPNKYRQHGTIFIHLYVYRYGFYSMDNIVWKTVHRLLFTSSSVKLLLVHGAVHKPPDNRLIFCGKHEHYRFLDRPKSLE
jgi:hypothetical protein